MTYTYNNSLIYCYSYLTETFYTMQYSTKEIIYRYFMFIPSTCNINANTSLGNFSFASYFFLNRKEY